MSRVFLLGALAVFVSVTATAQDGSEVLAERTTASANAFLDQFLRDSRARIRVLTFFPNYYGGSDRKRFQNWRIVVDGEDYNTQQVMANAGVVAVTQHDCVSDFTLNDLRYRGSGGGQLDPYDVPLTAPGQTATYRINWSQVLRATVTQLRDDSASSPGFHLNVYMASGSFADFVLPTLEEANRLAFAMEFLRAACVPRSTTGF